MVDETEMPIFIMAWPEFPGSVTGDWSANTFYSDNAVRYVRAIRANTAAKQAMGETAEMNLSEPENVELRLDDDGVKRWWIGTREGWQHCGHDGLILELSAEHFAVGTTITLVEPVE